MARSSDAFSSSTGQALAGGEWLDAHFEASRPEYEAQLRAVGIQPGWHVLDAACGSGSYLPWMAELVGPGGRISALDLAPENVALVDQRLAEWNLPCSVRASVGTVLDLPYPDDIFDAVWFANTSQYLPDDELDATLAEFRRVVRPGGLVALKESDATLVRIYPGPPDLPLRFFQLAASAGDLRLAGCLRAPGLPSRLRQAGLANVWQRTTLIERTVPLDPATHTFWSDGLAYWSRNAAGLNLPAADQEFWEQLRDSESLEHFLNDPDCCIAEGNILTVGTVAHNEGAS